jgi:Nucleotidyl transferase AbiEii toxin, Type IV TA system
MLATFTPRLDALPESQRLFWPELDAVPSIFVLYGGTGLALQLGNRVSEDFDFFSSAGFDPNGLQAQLPFFRDMDPADTEGWVHRKRDNLEAFIDRGGAIKVAFFGGLDTLHRVEDPRLAAGSRVQVASLVDLAGMKMRVIQVRGSWKDYVASTLWYPTASTCQRVWRRRKPSTGISIRLPASGRCSFTGMALWTGSRLRCGGI